MFSRPRFQHYSWCVLGVSFLSACPLPDRDVPEPADPSAPVHSEKPVLGSSDFLSADGYAGQDSPEGSPDPAPAAPEDANAADSDGSGGERSVEEGDIYRNLGDGLLANLNAYRGLQLIDFSEPETPEIIGRLQVTGTPVEMYVRNGVAYVLLNDWRGYSGSRFAADVELWQGGVVLAVDVSEPTRPLLLDRAIVPGNIRKSRLIFNEVHSALYVVTGGYDRWSNADGSWSWESRTIVKSFDVSDGMLTEKGVLNLGGYVADIQATPEALLVARNDWSSSDAQTQVSIIDISDPEGTMVEGDQVPVAGYIQNQFNLDLHQDVLRVVSGSRWSSGATNHVETFDASDIQNLIPIDHKTFGDNQDLYATLFLGNKAFFVTYLRVDPFHAFEITDEGIATERSEFIVSGWNDFFRPVFGEGRLIGIGVNDEQSRTMAVSLYDITDLDNAEPLIQRAEVSADASWSEATYDHRAFSVIENAVEVVNGETVETGLVLLPFSGWNQDEETYKAGVQIFTFSENTLTRRGFMDHGTRVRRSFFAEEDLTANLSEAALSFFETETPDNPVELGRLELAPNYTDIHPLNEDVAIRVTNSQANYWGWWGADAELPPALAEIIPRNGDIDAARPLATIEIPSAASTYVVGERFVTAERIWVEDEDEGHRETRFVVYDLSDPSVPVQTGSVQSAELLSEMGYGGWGLDDCWDCYWGYGSTQITGYPLDGQLLFPQLVSEREALGTERICRVYATEPESCDDTEQSCAFVSGSIRCSSLNGAPEECTGEIRRCTYSFAVGADGEEEYVDECEVVDPDTVRTEEDCWENERYRYWRRYVLSVLDLRDPTAPGLHAGGELPHHQHGVNVVVADDALWITTREPVTLENDPRPYQRYFANRVQLGADGSLDLSPGVNIPGTLVAADGDELYTRDLLWGEDEVETWVHRLRVNGDSAVLEQTRSFAGRRVLAVQLDGAGHLLVTHRELSSYGVGPAVDIAVSDEETGSSGEPERIYQQLTLLDAADDLAVLSEVDVDTWAALKDARAGRALFQVPGGLLLMNLSDASQPYPQAYFPTRTWPRDIVVDDNDIMFAAGRYGLYRFGLNAFNLLDEEVF